MCIPKEETIHFCLGMWLNIFYSAKGGGGKEMFNIILLEYFWGKSFLSIIRYKRNNLELAFDFKFFFSWLAIGKLYIQHKFPLCFLNDIKTIEFLVV